LKQKFDSAQANAQSLQQKLDVLSTRSSEDQARAGQLTAQVKDLTQALHDRDATLDQKDELLAKDRDIRELMGARDLYVAEVYDVARTGETQKPYGRVFYTKGKSLIFYAYDLDQEAEVKDASTFQVWGRRGPDREQALNLGIGRAAYEAALDYAQLRVQGGRRIIEHQAIGAKLAGIAIRLEVARATIWRAAWASDHPEAIADRSLPDLPLQTIAQVFTSEAMLAAVKDAAECFGAMGVMRDMPLQKYVHDARVCLHSGEGGADATLRLAEVLAGYRRPAKTGT